MTLQIDEQKNLKIVRFNTITRITLANCEELKSTLKPHLTDEKCKMIMDFTNIEFIDSSGIGCIIALFKTSKSRGSELKLCNLEPDVLKIFELLHLQVIFDIKGTLESSVNDYLS